MKKLTTLLLLAVASGLAGAKLPPLSDEAKAKAAEAAAKAAWSDKVGAYQLCLVMDKVAARYLADAAKAGKTLQPAATPPCTDPGPFVYAPPAEKPLEAAGAHSPAATATAPPNSKTPHAELPSAKKP
jgi:hypothetical protein